MKAWEAAVVEVVIGGKPKDVHRLASAWRKVAADVPEHYKELGKLLKALCGEDGGWHGPAADEYSKVVKKVIEQIRQFEDDVTQMATQLDRSGGSLSKAISKIPVPLAKSRSWLVDVDHELPNGTPMDDTLQDPSTFVDALADDYKKNPASYHDFLQWAKDQNNEMNLRSAGKGDKDYSAPSEEAARRAYHPKGMNGMDEARDAWIKVWYHENTTAAAHAHHELRRTYDDERSGYNFGSGNGRQASEDYYHAGSSDPGGAGGAPGASGVGSAGVPTASAGNAGVPVDAGSTAGAGLPGSSTYDGSGADPWGSDAASAGGDGSAIGGSGLASASTPGGLGGPSGLGGAGGGGAGAGGVGAGAGLVGAGWASSGPERSPMPPLTSAQRAVAERRALDLGSGLGRRGGQASGAAGMMPHRGAGGGAGGAEQHQTWLTEDDDDIWGGGEDAAPSVLK